MEKDTHYKIGILAFGSLIDNPGKEIQNLEITRIKCKTPFKVEFARISSSRNNAPTLIPILDNSKGKITDAVIIVINDKTDLRTAKSILWRRERHKIDEKHDYKEPKNPTSKNVLVKELNNFYGVEKVLYTCFLPQEEYNILTPEKLADFAINSILSEAGEKQKDGIRYLASIKNFGIETEYSAKYEEFLLMKTGSNSLYEAIKKMDIKRSSEKNNS